MTRWCVLAGLSAAASILFSFWMSQSLFVNVPYLDDWALFPLAGKIKAGTWPISDLWQPHNEHRLFFHKLILSVWAAWTSWDFRLLPFINFLIIAAGARVVSSLPQGQGSGVCRWIAFFIVSAVVFSLRAVKVSVWVTMFSVYAVAAVSVAVLTYLSAKPNSSNRWWIAAGWAVFATFTFGSALMIWPAALPSLAASRRDKQFKENIFIWLTAAFAAYAAYFWNHAVPAHHPSFPSGWSGMAEGLWFILYYLGSLFYPLTPQFFGGLGLILWVWAAIASFKKRRMDAFFLGFLSIGLFVLLNAVVTAWARCAYGAFYGASDRYVPTSCWFWAVLILWLFFEGRLSFGRFISNSLAAGLLLSIFISAPAHCKAFEKSRAKLVEIHYFLSQTPLTEENLSVLYPFPEVAGEALPVFKQFQPVRLKP